MKSPLPLRIQLLGNFRLLLGDEPIASVNTPRLQGLLAYLVLHRETPLPRQHIAFQFWPNSSEKQAHTNLRKLLFQLRDALPEPDRYLQQDHLTVQWRPDAPHTVDVGELCQLLTENNTSNNAERLARIAQLYQGELLPGCFDEWLLPIRQQLQSAVMATLEHLINLHEHQREYQAGIHYAQRLLGIDPLHEVAYRRMMHLYVLNGERTAALHAYQTCADLLRRELDVEPAEETHALYRQILYQNHPTEATTKLFGDTPFVGRTSEWRTLLALWQQTQKGEAHFVSIAGEAGIGKTRLAEELIGWASAQGVRVARTRSYEAEGGLAYAPVTEWLRSNPLKTALKKLDKLWLSEIARLLPELLTEHLDLTPPTPLSEGWQRQRFFEALARALVVERSALLLLIDDLQWCDRETITWLRYLLRFAPHARLLLIGTWRSEAVDETHPLSTLLRDLGNANQLSKLELTALTAEETAQLAQQVAGRPITTSAIQQIFAITEGHPLFVVETVRAKGEERWEISTHNLPPLPPKVQGVIQSRLVQLSPEARELAGLAATIGRQFSLAVITHASQSTEETRVRALDELWQRRIVREVGAGNYDFSHDRIREVTYQGLSQARRQSLHRKVAEALEQIHSKELDKISGELAAHFELASLPDKALYYYLQAASTAFRLHAVSDADAYCKHGLRLLHSHSALHDNVQIELSLLVLSTTAAVAGAQGYGADQVRALYERALLLTEQVAADERTISVYYGLWAYYFTSSAFDRADRLAEKMPEQARRLNDAFLLELAQHGLGMTSLYRGNPAAALSYYRQSLGFIQSRIQQGATFQGTQTLTMMTHLFRALALWIHGYPDQARRAVDEALKIQQEQWTPLNQSVAFTLAAILEMYLHDRVRSLEYAKVAVAICDQYEMYYWRLYAFIQFLWAADDAASMKLAERIEHLKQQLEQTVQSGTSSAFTFNARLLAELQRAHGDLDESMAMLRRALEHGDQTGEQWWQADNLRFLGELWLETDDETQAETHFRRALAISQEQGAKSFELRAATSLARLWQQQGKTAAAHALLAPIYQWFSEGFDTPDLIEAQTLLLQL